MAGVKPEHSGKFALALKNAIALQAAGRFSLHALRPVFLEANEAIGWSICLSCPCTALVCPSSTC